MTQLLELHRQLGSLRRKRQSSRWVAGLAALALATLWLLVALAIFDWAFEPTRLQRAILFAASIALLVWVYRRYTHNWLAQRESEIDVALLVERERKIDSDLVAAIQFERPEAQQWGSQELEGAVIDYVSEFGRGWNLLEGFTRATMIRRMLAALITFALIVAAGVALPEYAKTFIKRLAFANAHYPTRTHLDIVAVNGRVVELMPEGEITANCAYGQPVQLVIVTSGELPDVGSITLKSVDSGAEASIPLTKVEAAAAPGVKIEAHQRAFVAELSRMVETIDAGIKLGDSRTDPARFAVVALPSVDMKLWHSLPAYLRTSSESGDPQELNRQVAVVEGSRVDVQVECKNKALASAELELEGKKYPLVPTDDKKNAWRLPAEGSPLAAIDRPLNFQVHVVDSDGLSPERPLGGFIRVKADRSPQISGRLVTRYVLPSAKPKIEIRASDDHGLSKVVAQVQVMREGKSEPEEVAVPVHAGKPVLGVDLPLNLNYALDIGQFRVKKGDQLKVTLEAVDYRGPNEGKVTRSEPLVINVTDESGILSIMSESDERSVRQIDAIIKRQLGIGEKP